MLCKKCKKEIPDESKFCNLCGTKQVREKSSKKRGNGQGTVYKGPDGKWIAEYTIGWDEVDGKLNRKMRRKKGFATKNEALAYLPELKQDVPQTDMNIKFKDLYKKWTSRCCSHPRPCRCPHSGRGPSRRPEWCRPPCRAGD